MLLAKRFYSECYFGDKFAEVTAENGNTFLCQPLEENGVQFLENLNILRRVGLRGKLTYYLPNIAADGPNFVNCKNGGFDRVYFIVGLF